MILRYNSFIEDDLLFESLINETYVYYVKDFKDVLYKLSKSSEIAKDLIDLEFRDVKNDMTFISLSDREGYISGSTLRNLKNNVEKSFRDWCADKNISQETIDKNLEDLLNRIENGKISQSSLNTIFKDYDLGTKSRNDVKLGRLVNALLPGKYTSKDIEEFTNKFKATLSKQGEHFDEVSGDDINNWYNYENYKEMSGTLGNSCMAKKSGLFTIYTENPDVCKMLILVEDDKLIGRALVWKLSSIKIYGKEVDQNSWFMDRQYTIKDSDVEKFRNYAKEKGWIYKSSNNHHSFSNVTIEGEEKNAELTVQVKAKNYGRYPYMDTFRRFDPNEGTLYNDEDEDESYEGQYILADTGGGYEEIRSGVWSEWHDRRIPHDRAVWSDWADSYIDRDYATYVETGSRRNSDAWYPEDCDDIVLDGWNDEAIHIDDAVYSEAYGYYLYDQNAVEVIKKIDSDGEALGADSNWYHRDDDDIIQAGEYRGQTWYKVLSKEWSSWVDYDWALRDLFIYKDEPIPIRYKLDIYSIKGEKPEELEDVEYLSEVDALVLGVKVNNEKERLTDKFAYEDSILPIRDMIKSKLKTEIKRIEDVIEEKGQLQIKFSDEDKEKYMNQLRKRLEIFQERVEEIDTNEFIEKD